MNLPCGLHNVEKCACPALVVGLVLVSVLDIGFVVKAVDDCLLYTYDAADDEDSVDLGGRRIINKKTIIYSNIK